MMPEFPPWLIWILLPLAILHFFNILKSLKSSTNHATLPPGPEPLPIVGNLFTLGNKPHRSLARLAKAYGPAMSLKLGQVITIVISSPELAREVLMKKDQAFCCRWVPDVARASNHHHSSLAWLPASQKWKSLRTICSTQLFTSQRLDCNKELRHKKVKELLAYLRGCGVANEPVDVGRAAFMTSLNLLSNTLFSVDMVDPCSDSAQDFRDLMWHMMEDAGSGNISDFFPLLRALDLQGKRRRMEGRVERLHTIFDELIDQRLQAIKLGSGTNKDFLDALINCHELDRHVIKSLLLDVFVAGTSTSSDTVEWVMAELLRNPESMAKARTELFEAFNKETKVDESDILRLPYLQAVVKETLRLHPPVPLLLPRRTEMNVELCGYSVPTHARVLVNVWAIGRDEKIWEDPDAFMPERFLTRDVEYKGRDFELIPFGAGRRLCPGLPLAFRMVHLMLASLLHAFNWKLTDGLKAEDVDISDKFGLTLALATPIRAIPIPDERCV